MKRKYWIFIFVVFIFSCETTGSTNTVPVQKSNITYNSNTKEYRYEYWPTKNLGTNAWGQEFYRRYVLTSIFCYTINSTVSTGLYMLRRLSAARATKKRSRAYALCAFFLRHIFCALELLRNSFIAHKKRRIQPEHYVPFLRVLIKITIDNIQI